MKKILFINMNKKLLFILILIFLCIVFSSLGIYHYSKNVIVPISKYVVVIDPGHGGIDAGVIGASGNTNERDINLAYSFCLGAYFESLNFEVIYTRKDSNGLYSEFAKNKKIDDMKKREKIIKESKPDLVISMHQNGFTLPDQRGATVFYQIGNNKSKEIANQIQERLKKKIKYARNEALPGDYYILNCSNNLSILLECGFLTNPEEEMLLNDKRYMNEICHQIFTGCISYFIKNNMLIY